jgi:hypothetical protein
MNLPKRRRPQKMNCNQPPQIRSAGHLKWIRGHQCAVCGEFPSGYPIEAAHVRTGTDGGMGVKPSDCWTLPLCSHHHRDQHLIGEAEFESIFKIDMKSIARALWSKSPHAKKQRTP